MDNTQLLEIANNPDVRGINDFLSLIPAGSLQTFTLVYQSESLQREDVDYDWPRVIRLSGNGRLAIAYTCKPSAPSYNKIEVIHFKDPTQEFKTAEIDLNLPPRGGPGLGETHRVTPNPQSCLQCHDKANHVLPDPHPLWRPYNRWNGVYGSLDDSFQNNPIERDHYTHFRALQANNPCYSTLPWAHGIHERNASDETFPYSDQVKGDFRFRPNLRMTMAFSLLANHRLARLIEGLWENPSLKYLLTMKALGCDPPGVSYESLLHSMLPNYHTQSSVNITEMASVALGVGIALGIPSPDWTLSLHPENLEYNTGLANPNPAALSSLLIDELVSHVLSEIVEPRRRELGILLVPEQRRECRNEPLWHLETENHLSERCHEILLRYRAADNVEHSSDRLTSTAGPSLGDLPHESAAQRGFQVIQQRCVQCHAAFPWQQWHSLDSGFSDRVILRMGSTLNPMPPNGV